MTFCVRLVGGEAFMSALDSCEPQIIRALEKEGWQIQQKPFVLRSNIRTVLADFSVKRSMNGSTEQIVVLEVKCFTNPQSDLSEFYTAVGQYGLYREALNAIGLHYSLYLAIPDKAYERLTQDNFLEQTLKGFKVKMLLVDLESEEIVRWIR
jgi:hypothetical protein